MEQKKRLQCSLFCKTPEVSCQQVLTLNVDKKVREARSHLDVLNTQKLRALVARAARQWAGVLSSQASLGLAEIPVSTWTLHTHTLFSDIPTMAGDMMTPPPPSVFHRTGLNTGHRGCPKSSDG